MTTTAAALYAELCAYVASKGWAREEPGSGWWWHAESGDDSTLGEAVEKCLQLDGVELREEPTP